MSAPARLKGHPIHPMLIPLPIGLWIFALVGDVAAAMTGSPEWRTVAFYSIGGGLVGALLAAVPGLIDLLSLPSGAVRRKGVWHMALNLTAVALFAANFLIRWPSAERAGPLLLTLAGVALIGVAGWLGGELVYVHHVGVEPAPPGPGQASRA